MSQLVECTLDFLLVILHDDSYRLAVLCSGIILACLTMIYRSITHKKPLAKVPNLRSPSLHPAAVMRTLSDSGENVKEGLKGAVMEVREFVAPRRVQRFRKRDRVMFYGRQLIRTVENNVKYVDNVRAKRQAQGKHMVSRFAKAILGSDKYSECSEEEGARRPAEDWLEEEDEDNGSMWIPAELRYLLSCLHMFSQFDPSLFAELCPAIETVKVSAGQFLFKIGDPDEFIFVVQSGRLNVTVSDRLGGASGASIKKVGPGDSVTSLLSFMELLTGNARPFKTVQAMAEIDSLCLKLPVDAFLPIFDKRPELLIRIVQMIMARVQRVFFVALHQYLGLSSELINEEKVGHEEGFGMGYSSLSLDQELQMAAGLSERVSVERELDLAVAGTDEMKLAAGVKGLQGELGLDDDTFLWDVVQVRRLAIGDTVMTEMSHRDVALIYIIEGELTLYQLNDGRYDELYTAVRGTSVGQLNMLSGDASCYTCRAVKPSLVALLSKNSFFELMAQSPEIVLALAHSTIKELSPLARQLDFALDWITVEGGRGVVSPGLSRDNVYILLSGRLRGYVTTNGTKKLVGEYGRGDMVGIVDVIVPGNSPKSYLAARDSEICLIPAQTVTFLKSRCQVVLAKLVTFLGDRLTSGPTQGLTTSANQDKSPIVKYSTIAIFPTSERVPITAFCLELEHSLAVAGPVVRISSTDVLSKLGPTALDAGHEYRLTAWLSQREDRNSTVIYQCDTTCSTWTKKCLRYADDIFVLALAAEGPAVTSAERDLEQMSKRIRKDLVLLHSPETKHPTGTKNWLKKRPWISANFHVKMNPMMTKKKTERKIQEVYRKVLESQPDIHSDISRLARHVTGGSIGLVLGGGGARGAAHLGMLQTIIEAGIPIDKVGGVSIGAFVTALWAIHRNIEEVNERSKKWFKMMVGNTSAILDLTYPITALFKGAYFNRTILETFSASIDIEDLWVPFYCVSTDITTSRERLHNTGQLWRYVRASMTFAWILPPICDPVDGHLLMDGCYVNNVPGDIMLKSGCAHILVVDVTASDSTDLTNFGDTLSGWWMLWKRINPFASTVKIPDQSEIQQRLMYCSHYKNLAQLQENPQYEYIQPPVGHFSSSVFSKFEEIRAAGYHHGDTFFSGLRRAGGARTKKAWSWLPTADRYRVRNTKRRDSGSYVFTDLAELVMADVKTVNIAKKWRQHSKTRIQKRNQEQD